MIGISFHNQHYLKCPWKSTIIGIMYIPVIEYLPVYLVRVTLVNILIEKNSLFFFVFFVKLDWLFKKNIYIIIIILFILLYRQFEFDVLPMIIIII